MKNSLPRYITSLLSPDIYPDRVEKVELLQTHSSYVLLAGQFVYKFKKNVDFGFLDFSSFDKRHYYCQQELKLNRRLCPDIYLDIVPVMKKGDHYFLKGQGEVIEYGVFMKRLPEDRMMSTLIKNNQLTAAHIDQVAETLTPFYQSAEQNDKINEYGRVSAIGKNIHENFNQIEPFIDEVILTSKQYMTIRKYALAMLQQENVFNQRIVKGFIHDCHGDLHSANICIDQTIHIYDCIEFNNRLRYGDIAADIGFLAMDLDYHGLSPLADRFVNHYCDDAHDDTLYQLLPFYKCYRAVVRGKIGLLTAADPAVEENVKRECLENARRYFELAELYTK